MITTFYFDLELFDDTALRNQSLANGVLLETWRDFGCLVYEKDTFEALRLSIKHISPKYSQKWTLALTKYKRTEITDNLEKLSDFESFESLKTNLLPLGIKTALISSDYINIFKQHSCSKTDFELVAPTNINESINFNKSCTYSSKDIVTTENLDEIWKSRFQSLASHSKVITIIDRFSVKNIIDDHNNGKETSIENFFKLLSKTGKKFSIKLFSACDIDLNKKTNASEVKNYLNNILRKKIYYNSCISQFDISLCKNKLFGREAHDRMLRFDDHIIQIGNGLDIFRESPILYNTFNIKRYELTDFNGIHRKLQNNIEPGCSCL